MTAASSPLPESQERRTALAAEVTAATGLDEATLERLVRAFYETARADPVIGPKFDHVADWEAHFATISDFWSNIVLMTARYDGRPMPAHIPLDLHPAHFARWLDLFEATARRVCTPAGADFLMERARRIAQSLETGTAIYRDTMAGRAG